MSSNSSSELLCPNWVFSNTSNVHACKNRGWFTDYTPFESFLGSLYASFTMPVLGVGTVILPTEKDPYGSGPSNHTQLILHDVLHVPSILCNILGMTEGDRFHITWGRESELSMGTIRDMQEQRLAYFDPNKRLFQVKLSDPPVGPVVGPSVLDQPNTCYTLNVHWALSELGRWKEYKGGNQSRTGPASESSSAPAENNTAQNPQSGLEYTEEEKEWMKVHYGGEFRFLLSFGLSMYDDGEREEGRAIVRGLMAKDGSNSEGV